MTPNWLKYENQIFGLGLGYIFKGIPEENETLSITFNAYDQNKTFYRDEFTLFKDTNFPQKPAISAKLQESLEE